MWWEMREKLAWIRNVPFRKLQLRVMLYLLVFGLVPTVCTILFFYHQSASASRTELANLVNRSQQLVVDQLEMEIKQLENKAIAINSDAEVQRMLGETSLPYTIEDGSLLSYLHQMIPLWKSGNLQSSNICFSFYASNTSVCGDSSIIQLEQSLYNTKDQRIDKITSFNGQGELIRYIAPLYEMDTGSVLGHIAIIIDLHAVLSDLNILDYPSEIILSDMNGNPLLESTDALFNRDSEYYESIMTVRVLADQWVLKTSVLNKEFVSYQANLVTIFILFLPLLLIFSLIGAFIFSRILTRPLQYLRSLMKRAELGDLKAYWTYKSSQDIDELGESYNQMLNRLEDVIKQVKIEESLKKEKEFEALQYQLNPHFLYNTLNTIKWVAKIHKTPQISEVVSALVRLLQVSLNKKGDFITVREEVGLVKDYMDIQTFRYGETIQIETNIDPLAAQCLVPTMILQPLVENAIIHGLDQSNKEDKRIMIRAWIERDLLFCQVEDNGRGLDHEQLMFLDAKANVREGIKERLSGIGLKHIREKIRLYYGPDYSMQIFSKLNQGTTIRLSLPIHQSEG
jgi:sensor histidine kinase YesM